MLAELKYRGLMFNFDIDLPGQFCLIYFNSCDILLLR